ncbi:hypothetical protein [Parafrankia sp. EUN1f]|uniref:hypothetical protein n=1 Tax=Parafrankia sp. EUN1f TaxID=102897 RepID=UPI0002DF2919|nr:hypothetical protein [Parafrankia sp. EUN1f]
MTDMRVLLTLDGDHTDPIRLYRAAGGLQLPAGELHPGPGRHGAPEIEIGVDVPQAPAVAGWLRANWLVRPYRRGAVVPFTHDEGVCALPEDLLAGLTSVQVVLTVRTGGQTVAEHVSTWQAPPSVSADDSGGSAVIGIDFGMANSAIALLYRTSVEGEIVLDSAQTAALARALAHGSPAAGAGGTASPPGYAFPTTTQVDDEIALELDGIAEQVDIGQGLDTASTVKVLKLCQQFEAAVADGESEDGRIRVASRRGADNRLRRYLDEAYRAAQETPPLGSAGLHRIAFDGPDTRRPTVVPSDVRITGTDPLALELSYIAPTTQLVNIPAFKRTMRHLARLESLPLADLVQGIETDLGDDLGQYRIQLEDAFGKVFHSLRQQGQDHFAARMHRGPRPAPQILDVVATYPTTTTPATRAILLRLLSERLGLQINNSVFDEAVAAALFFVMTDLGANHARNIPLLRAKGRAAGPPAREPDGTESQSWHRIMLVADVGGGTTDIALLRLVLTRRITHRNGNRIVRHYLRPDVVGSSGHGQLGGNYLTLRVLYWLKAIAADRISSQQPSGAGDTRLWSERVLSSSHSTPLTAAHADELDRIVPTRVRAAEAKDRPGVRDRFVRLWNEAEQAKILLGGGADHQIKDPEALFDLKALSTVGTDPAAGPHLANEPITLRATDFERLVRPVLDRIAGFAAELACTALRHEPEHLRHIDEVVLAGASSAMPAMSTAFRRALLAVGPTVDPRSRAVPADGVPVVWRPEAVRHAGDYAKEAVAHGAAWGAYLRMHHAAVTDGSEAAGVGSLVIDTSRMFGTLPNDFLLGMADWSAMPSLLWQGQLLHRVEGRPANATVVRSVGFGMRENVELWRRLAGHERIPWAVFRYRQVAERDGLRLDHRRWAGEHAVIQAHFELDEELTPFIVISHGLPTLLASGPGAAVLPNLRSLDDDTARDLLVQPNPTGAGAGAAKVFQDGGDPRRGGSPRYQRQRLRLDQPGGGTVVEALLSLVPLPPPGRDGWAFQLGADPATNGATHVLEVRPPDSEGDHGSYFASLDERGDLRVHAGLPDYLMAASLKDLEGRDMDGFSVRLPMDYVEPAWKEELDPFNGLH